MGLRERMHDLHLEPVDSANADRNADKAAAREYHRRFVTAAKQHLDPRTFAQIHHHAKSSTGGAAPRKSKEPVNKSRWSLLTDMWATAVQAITGTELVEKDAGTPDCGMTVPHVDAPIENRPRKKKRGKRVPPANSDVVVKHYDDLAARIAEADGVESTGFALQIDEGGTRVPGFLGYGTRDDQFSMVSTGPAPGHVPFEDGIADVIYVAKSAFDKHGPALLKEVKRIAKPFANIITEDGIEEIAKRANADPIAIINKVEKAKPGHVDEPLDKRLERCSDERVELVRKAMSEPFPIAGVNKHEQIVYGPVLVPDERHFSGDYMTPEDIRHTAHGYMTNGRLIGAEHQRDIDACIVESFIAPCDLHFDGSNSPYGEQYIPKGSWVAAVKVNDPGEWQKVLSGQYTGFSTGGWGARGQWEE